MKWFLFLLVILLIALILQAIELTRFTISGYELTCPKLQNSHCFAVVTDLHGFSYGEGNIRLLAAIRQCQPDGILLAGDLTVAGKKWTQERAYEFLTQTAAIAPVYYGLGNHESRDLHSSNPLHARRMADYLDRVRALGVTILDNTSILVQDKEDNFVISGLSLPLSYYKKGRNIPLEEGLITESIGKSSRDATQILIAHNPTYSKEYAAWGADLTVCGHYHGGLVRVPGVGSLISPQLTLFPKYDAGMYSFGERSVLVSRGLGTHRFHVRIFNRAELLCVTVKPASKK